MTKTRYYSERTAAACCRRLLKAGESQRRDCGYSWIDEAGRQCFMDGYRAYRLTAALPDMPQLPTGKEPYPLGKIFAPLDAGAADLEEIPAPDRDAVEAFIKDYQPKHKGKRSYDGQPYSLGEIFPSVNPFFLLEVLKLFPAARWYVSLDERRRMYAPIFAACPEGSALIMPIRDKAKIKPDEAETTAKPAPVYKYFIYARRTRGGKYFLSDLAAGKIGVKKVMAPRYTEEQLERLRDRLDELAAAIPGAAFQVRTTDGKTVVYEAVPTFTPEEFLKQYAA